MSALKDLKSIEAEMIEILGRFKHSREGVWIADGDQAAFIGLCLEASDIIDAIAGPANSFSLAIRSISANGRVNFAGSQSYASVDETIAVVRSAIRKAMRAGNAAPTKLGSLLPQPQSQPYIGEGRLTELRQLPDHTFDFRRLIRMCEELNESFAAEHYIASAALLRAIKDHVAPALGAANFAEYVAGQNGRSHKGSMEHLATSLKHIADQWLHGQIRRRDTLPTAQQVDFRQDLDVLLSEIVRIHHT